MGARVCPLCGAYLDPAERCDCMEKPSDEGSVGGLGGKDNYNDRFYYSRNYEPLQVDF